MLCLLEEDLLRQRYIDFEIGRNSNYFFPFLFLLNTLCSIAIAKLKVNFLRIFHIILHNLRLCYLVYYV